MLPKAFFNWARFNHSRYQHCNPRTTFFEVIPTEKQTAWLTMSHRTGKRWEPQESCVRISVFAVSDHRNSQMVGGKTKN